MTAAPVKDGRCIHVDTPPAATCYRAVTKRDRTLPLPFPRFERLVRRETLGAALRERELTHREFAGLLGIHPSTWSRLFNRHRPLTRKLQALLLACPVLGGAPEEALWDVVELSPRNLT